MDGAVGRLVAREGFVQEAVASVSTCTEVISRMAHTEPGTSLGQGWAPGKALLLGEHAVVYGHPAVAAALDRGVRVVVETGTSGPRVVAPFAGVDAPLSEEAGSPPVCQALERVRLAVAPHLVDVVLRVEDGLPVGAGLGSSAALSVAVARALADAAGVALSVERVFDVVREAERVFHGTPSGVDQATVARGGILWFKRNMDDINGAPQIRVLRAGAPFYVVVAMLRPHWGTREAVAALRARRERHRRTMDALLGELGALAEQGAAALERGDLRLLGELMDLAHGILHALGVSSPDLDGLVAFAREHGALGAKLTGAGVGGAIIALVDSNARAQALVEAFTGYGARAFSCVLGASTPGP